ncbi:MAG: DUF2917 domain-containing protein [Syntrophobacter sp.]
MECLGACEYYRGETGRPGLLKRVLHGCLNLDRRVREHSSLVRIVRPDKVRIHKSELCVLDISGWCAISCVVGSAWVTYPGRRCDYVLNSGESLKLRGEGRVIVSGCSDEIEVRICRS